jgi:hypothetical protein
MGTQAHHQDGLDSVGRDLTPTIPECCAFRWLNRLGLFDEVQNDRCSRVTVSGMHPGIGGSATWAFFGLKPRMQSGCSHGCDGSGVDAKLGQNRAEK